MALRFMDGFDYYNNATQLLQRWSSQGSSSQGTPGRFSTRCWQISLGSTRFFQKDLDSQPTWIICFAFRGTGLPTADAEILVFLDSGTQQFELNMNSSAQLFFSRNGTTVGSPSTFVAVLDQWYYFQVKVTINNSGQADVQLGSDPTPILSFTGDTQNTANASANQIKFMAGGGNATFQFDDVAMLDGTGGALDNFFPGELRIDALFPNAVGNQTDWTRNTGAQNFNAVDEQPPNEDTDYVASSTPTHIDLYGMTDNEADGDVVAVQTLFRGRRDDAGPREVRTKIRTNALNFNGATKTMETNYDWYVDLFLTNPDTAVAWTPSEVNAAEFGVEVVT